MWDILRGKENMKGNCLSPTGPLWGWDPGIVYLSFNALCMDCGGRERDYSLRLRHLALAARIMPALNPFLMVLVMLHCLMALPLGGISRSKAAG